MPEKIKFLKVREVKSPTRANKHDAGIDFFVPEFTVDFVNDLKAKNPLINISKFSIFLEHGERILIPSGIHCQMNGPERALIAANKSGIASKHGLIFGAQVIDYEYQGEIHLNLIYTGTGTVEILPGQKILQFLETPIYTSKVEIIENTELDKFYSEVTTRGEGGFGSSNK